MDTIQIIVELLNIKGVSAARMSRELGFSNAVFTQWKQGKQKPSSEKLQKMAEYFNVSTDYLLGKTENPTTTNDSEVKDLQDPVTVEILDIISKLSPEGQDWAISQLRSLVELEAKKGK